MVAWNGVILEYFSRSSFGKRMVVETALNNLQTCLNRKTSGNDINEKIMARISEGNSSIGNTSSVLLLFIWGDFSWFVVESRLGICISVLPGSRAVWML